MAPDSTSAEASLEPRAEDNTTLTAPDFGTGGVPHNTGVIAGVGSQQQLPVGEERKWLIGPALDGPGGLLAVEEERGFGAQLAVCDYAP